MSTFPVLQIPRGVPMLPVRQPQANIPQTRPERERLRQAVSQFLARNRETIVPPLVLDELRKHAETMIAETGFNPAYRDYAGVLLNNEVWREHLATVPYERRLLLLPKCLRIEDKCPAPFDDFGLLCKQCGLCSIQDLQEEAEKLGYACLVAEGSALVMAMIQTGKIDAIVGVSCLSVLERAFPYMEAAAIPGVAIPLLQDDCKDTGVDIEWVWDVIHLTSDDKTRRLDLDAMRREVDSWFTRESLEAIFDSESEGLTETIAREWLSRAGKRWRPFLSVCTWKAMQEDPDTAIPDDLKKIAVAVECFHKASLVHDDIEDEDSTRYGESTLHAEHGVAVALNVGDLLIGEGYRLLAETQAPASVRARMTKIAAGGHRSLCLGQGAELVWARNPAPLQALQVLDIFRKKTAPAFEVALRLGAAYAGAGADVDKVLIRYSEALGIAYQIRDDIEDLDETHAPGDVAKLRPSLPLAIAFERAKGEQRELLSKAWRRELGAESETVVRATIADLKADERCRNLLESYKEQAIRSLPDLRNASLKGLLRRVIGKIFSLEIKGWCSEFEARNAAGGEARATAPR